MSAIQEQTYADWEKNLRTVAGLSPEHISAYSLFRNGTHQIDIDVGKACIPCHKKALLKLFPRMDPSKDL